LPIFFRQAQLEDFEYCAKLYVAEWEQSIGGHPMESPYLLENFRRQRDANQARIITGEGRDLGWLHCAREAADYSSRNSLWRLRRDATESVPK
jgi:hypothetical protein